MKSEDVIIRKVDPLRRLIHDVSWLGKQKHHIHINAEVDITESRKSIKKLSQPVSLLSYFIYCFAQAMKKHPELNSCIVGRKQFIFNSIDLSLIIERKVGDKLLPMNYIIRDAGSRNIFELDKEIKDAKSTAIGEKMLDKKIQFFSKLPWFLRKLIWKFIFRKPNLMKEFLGTTGMTSAYNYSKGMFWGIPISPLTSTLSIGSVYYKTIMKNGVPEEATKLCVTLCVDHDVIDGGEAGRYMLTFSDYIKNSHGLSQ